MGAGIMKKLGLVGLVMVVACAEPPKDDAKGQVDESAPPSIPLAQGKADASSNVIAVNVQSPHPYANNVNKLFAIPTTGLPSCAKGARVHFKVLRTEDYYDHVSVEALPAVPQSYDGTHDQTWTEWFDVNSTTKINVRLQTDSSITRHGFEVDALEWRGAPICPAIAWPACDATTVNIQKTPGTCECPQIPVCAPLASIEVSHFTARGFNRTTKAVHGTTATYTHPGPTDGPVTDTVGTVDQAKLADIIHRAGQLGLLQGAGYDRTVPAGDTTDTFTLHAGTFTVAFTAAQGSQDAAVQSVIDDFETLFGCDTGGGLTCGSGLECQENTCVATQSCICTADYNPVCGSNGHTYGNACNAGCANVPVAHNGACGIAGDSCGTLFGLTCQDDYKCRFGVSTYTYPFPDAGGTCVAANYCDAPADCNGLIHPQVLGAWQCNQNACAWVAGQAWKSQTDGHFETAHPYANSTSVWKQLYLPAEAQALRLNATKFRTEAGYDKLEVWTWQNNDWVLKATFSGTTGPALTQEFPGQYHYLHFVSDSSVTDSGVTLDAQWR